MIAKTLLTRINILVLLGCVILVVMNVGAIGTGGRRRARELICLSNLHQWGGFFRMYTNDNNGYFFSGEYNGSRLGMGSGMFWRISMKPCSQDIKMWLCPQATKSRGLGIPRGDRPFVAWETSGDIGSYGLNGWILNLPAAKQPQNRGNGWGRADMDPRTGKPRHWYTPNVKNANNVPVFADMWWADAWPLETDQPPPTETGPADTPGTNEMNRVCVNRHEGSVNSLFCDWSARKVALKDLWILKWHRTFNTCGPWTKCGGVQPEHWPEWMGKFKDY